MPFLNRSKELGVVPCVTATGNVSNVAQYLWKGEVYIHSAKYEPFGLVLVEAMAAGLPVIALDAGGNRDIVEDGVNGYLLPKDTNPKVFAEKSWLFGKTKNCILPCKRRQLELQQNTTSDPIAKGSLNFMKRRCSRLNGELLYKAFVILFCIKALFPGYPGAFSHGNEMF